MRSLSFQEVTEDYRYDGHDEDVWSCGHPLRQGSAEGHVEVRLLAQGHCVPVWRSHGGQHEGLLYHHQQGMIIIIMLCALHISKDSCRI